MSVNGLAIVSVLLCAMLAGCTYDPTGVEARNDTFTTQGVTTLGEGILVGGTKHYYRVSGIEIPPEFESTAGIVVELAGEVLYRIESNKKPTPSGWIGSGGRADSGSPAAHAENSAARRDPPRRAGAFVQMYCDFLL